MFLWNDSWLYMCRTHVSSTISSRGKNHVYTPFSSPQSVSQVPVPHRVARPLQTCASLYEHEIKHIWRGTVPLLAHINDVSRLLAHNTSERTLIALLAPQAFLTARFLPGISHAQLHTTLSKGLADMSAAQFNVATADADIVKFLKVLLTYNQQFSRRHNLQDLRSTAFYSELFLDLANTAETHQLPDTAQWCIAEGLTRSRMSHDITLLYSTFFRKLLSAPFESAIQKIWCLEYQKQHTGNTFWTKTPTSGIVLVRGQRCRRWWNRKFFTHRINYLSYVSKISFYNTCCKNFWEAVWRKPRMCQRFPNLSTWWGRGMET